MIKRKNLLLHASLDDSYPDIKPSKTFIPNWYRKSERFGAGIKDPNFLPLPMGFKMCASFSDSFTSGYILPLPVDIAIKQGPDGPIISWNDTKAVYVEQRDPEINKEIPTPIGFANNHFTWQTKHMFKIPKGYSALMTHPLNRYDLPFLTLSGIVDGELVLHNGSIPVFFSSTFEGIIEAGTPILQILLFKTENWDSEKNKSIIEEGFNNQKKGINKSFGWYKKNIWQKKVYQ
jgi:hypothetical protein